MRTISCNFDTNSMYKYVHCTCKMPSFDSMKHVRNCQSFTGTCNGKKCRSGILKLSMDGLAFLIQSIANKMAEIQ